MYDKFSIKLSNGSGFGAHLKQIQFILAIAKKYRLSLHKIVNSGLRSGDIEASLFQAFNERNNLTSLDGYNQFKILVNDNLHENIVAQQSRREGGNHFILEFNNWHDCKNLRRELSDLNYISSSIFNDVLAGNLKECVVSSILDMSASFNFDSIDRQKQVVIHLRLGDICVFNTTQGKLSLWEHTKSEQGEN